MSPESWQQSLEVLLQAAPREQFRAKLLAELLKFEGENMTDTITQLSGIREGFRTINVYLISPQGPEVLDFVKTAFGAEEMMRSVGSAGGMHAEVKLGDSMLMIGGGLAYKGPARTCAIHYHVPDVDATYARALAAGATSISEPVDQPYGERGCGVKDLAGNMWFIATVTSQGPGEFAWRDMPQVQPYFFAKGSFQMIEFLEKAFGGTSLGQHTNPDGTIAHATIRVGTATVELSEARDIYQPLPSTFYMYVPDVDATFASAVAAGASVMFPPTEQSYGDRNAGVLDPFGNEWYIGSYSKAKS